MAVEKIPHTEIAQQFYKHICLEDNKRILFSGPFGTGKSTFLREIFDARTEYLTVSLSPINYSIGANEDVFEWIKIDILLELINGHASELNLTKEDFSIFLLVQGFLQKQSKELSIVSSIIGLSESIGKPIEKLLQQLKETLTDFQKYKTEMEADEGKLIVDYLKRFEDTAGSPYERDPMSKLIQSFLFRLKTNRESDSASQSVLVIDDLDRLDPEHMFRLFNVFSSHYDQLDNNKFGFDKVIFVCDVENIRRMFTHKYGVGVDFNGYIDKFYSKKVFAFDNRKLIKDVVRTFLKQLEFSDAKFEQHQHYKRGLIFHSTLEWILAGFIDSKEMNLRMLVQCEGFDFPSYTFQLRNISSELHAESYPLLVIFQFLRTFFPSLDVLESKLLQISETTQAGYVGSTRFHSSDIENIERAIATYCITFLMEEHRSFDGRYVENNNEGDKKFEFEDVVFHFQYFRERFDRTFWVNKITKPGDSTKVISINAFRLLYMAFQECRKKRII